MVPSCLEDSGVRPLKGQGKMFDRRYVKKSSKIATWARAITNGTGSSRKASALRYDPAANDATP